MNFKEILELIDKVSESGLGAVEVETSGVRLRIEGKAAERVIVQEAAPAVAAPAYPVAPAASVPAAPVVDPALRGHTRGEMEDKRPSPPR